MSNILTLNNQLKKFNKIHNNIYEYDYSTYINNSSKMRIICKEHGEFWLTPEIHKRGRGCPKCSKINRSLGILKKMINKNKLRFIKIHGNKYTYVWESYVNASTKMIIICPVHGEFLQTPDAHLSGKGCAKCAAIKRNRKRIRPFNQQVSLFIKVHNNKYTYDESTYVNASTKMRIICPIHGEFWQTPNKHMKCGCLLCVPELIKKMKTIPWKTQLSAFREIHGNKYDYDESTYINTITKMKIICSVHGEFWQVPYAHKTGSGCPNCIKSKGEIKIRTILNSINKKFYFQYRFEDCKLIKPLPFDFYLPKLNTCIEFNGIQHYEYSHYFHRTYDKFEEQQLRDKIKTEYCKNNNIRLIKISYLDFDKIEEILISILL